MICSLNNKNRSYVYTHQCKTDILLRYWDKIYPLNQALCPNNIVYNILFENTVSCMNKIDPVISGKFIFHNFNTKEVLRFKRSAHCKYYKWVNNADIHK